MRPSLIARWAAIVGPVLGALSLGSAGSWSSDDTPTDWLRKYAHRFDTCEPSDSARDLSPLDSIFGHARIVALGEVSSGTREFIQFKHRIVQYIATHGGITQVGLEERMPEILRLNDYVLHGIGDPSALLVPLGPRKHTREFLDFIEWARKFNRSGRGELRFFGFDMLGTMDSATAAVTRFIARAEPAYLDTVTRAYRLVAAAPPPESQFASARGLFPASLAAGHTVRFSGWIRAEGVRNGGARLWLRGDASRKGAVMQYSDRTLDGTRPWTRCDLSLEVPDSISTIVIGCMLRGSGTAWFDSLAFDIDGRPFPGDEGLDLTMEHGERPIGMDVGVPTASPYEIVLDSVTVFAGRRSLRIRHIGTASDGAGASWSEAAAAAKRVLEHLEVARARHAEDPAWSAIDWAIANARSIAQASLVNVGEVGRREDLMAENVARAVDSAPPTTRTILWEQNLRLARRVSLGGRLAKRYGRDLVVLGFAFHEGRYNAVAEGAPPGERIAKASNHGSLEWAFHSLALPRFLLDLRSAMADAQASAWLARPLPMRNYAFQATAEAIPVAEYFDALVFFDRTTPSTSLP